MTHQTYVNLFSKKHTISINRVHKHSLIHHELNAFHFHDAVNCQFIIGTHVHCMCNVNNVQHTVSIGPFFVDGGGMIESLRECSPCEYVDIWLFVMAVLPRRSPRHHMRFIAAHTCGWHPTTANISTPWRVLTMSVTYQMYCGPPAAHETTSMTHVRPITTTSFKQTFPKVAL